MPVSRTAPSTVLRQTNINVITPDLSKFRFKSSSNKTEAARLDSATDTKPQSDEVVDLAALSKDVIYFPTTSSERENYRTKGGKRVTHHQWAVYDLTRKIPAGKVTTYKDLCSLLGEGSPRSVGSALRNNPFTPFVPCHRIIASDLTLGGFYGEWGTAKVDGSQCQRKRQMLASEGVHFTSKGVLKEKGTMLWDVKDF